MTSFRLRLFSFHSKHPGYLVLILLRVSNCAVESYKFSEKCLRAFPLVNLVWSCRDKLARVYTIRNSDNYGRLFLSHRSENWQAEIFWPNPQIGCIWVLFCRTMASLFGRVYRHDAVRVSRLFLHVVVGRESSSSWNVGKYSNHSVVRSPIKAISAFLWLFVCSITP